MFQGKVNNGLRGHWLNLPHRHRCVDIQFLIHRPEHQVGERHLLVLVHIVCVRQIILTVCQIGLHLNHISMSLLPQLFLTAGFGQRLLGHRHLLLINVAEALVVHHVVVRLHNSQANISFHLLLLGVGNQHSRLRNLVVIHRLEAVEEVVTGTHAVIVVERRGVEIRVGLRVDAAAEVVVGVGLRTDLRSEQRQGGIPPVNLRIADGRLLNPDLGGIGDGILHTVPERHHPRPVGHTIQRLLGSGHSSRKTHRRHKNEYVKSYLHHTMIYHRARIEHLPCQM